jgi:ppGpp synthetase/RelA/SpoT-type nucleotidyltranferase
MNVGISLTDEKWLSGYLELMNELHQQLDGVLRKHTEDCFRQWRISEIIGRVKSHNSTIGKYQRWVNDGRVERRHFPEVVKSFGDLIGFRVICPRIGLAQVVDELLKKIGEPPADVEVEYKGSEPVNHESGYRAIHVALTVKLSTEQMNYYQEYCPPPNVECEVQIHTVFQNAWHTLDHRYRYKAVDDPSENLKVQREQRFKAWAGQLAEYDECLGTMMPENPVL